MCGIVAVRSFAGPVERERIASAVRALHHRGPDGDGIWLSEQRNVALGHARLSIIDLETGDQPIASEDEDVHIVVNGEFYDFERIRTELQSRHRFRTRSDSEIALHLYQDYGVHCLEHLRGEFAFALWDGRNRHFFAARDRFGIKPLYYGVVDGTLYVASEAKAIFAAGVPARWDHETLYHACCFQYCLPDRTFFEGIYQVPPGHYLSAIDGKMTVRRYWDVDFQEEPSTPRDDREYIDEMRSLFDEAVRLRLRADVPVAAYLSGGLDSCSIVAAATKVLGQPIDCFTISFEDESYDELAIAETMAKKAQCDLTPIHVSNDDIADHYSDAVYFSEMLAINGHTAAKYLLSRLVRQNNYKVVLTGEGADELAAGYPHFRQDLFESREARGSDAAEAIASLQTTNVVTSGILLPEGETLPIESARRVLGYVPTFLKAKATFGHRVLGILSGDFKSRYRGRDSLQLLLDGFDVEGQLRGRSRINQSTYLWMKVAFANYALRLLGDGTEMANSIEGRVPFLDHRLIEFGRRLPVSLKVRGTVEKYIIREAMRPDLPEQLLKREKHTFLAPPSAGSRVQTLIEDTLRGSTAATLPFVDQSKVIALLDQIPKSDRRLRIATDPVFMFLVSACVLQKRFAL